jgi:hypothetical protein
VFGASNRGASFGRYLNSIGEELFPAQANQSFGGQNAGPNIGPLVLNEIMYHPAAGFDEFIEVKNVSTSEVALSDPANPANTWKINGAGFTFPQAGQHTAWGARPCHLVGGIGFRSKYNIPAGVQIFGPFTGTLSDGSERISIQSPGTPIAGSPPTVPYITVDAVRYADRAPWPPSADGAGPSLQRVAASAFADDPANWFASGATPGRENASNLAPAVQLTSPGSGNSFTLRPASCYRHLQAISMALWPKVGVLQWK